MTPKEVKIICVLKKSDKFDIDYVAKLKEQLDTFMPDYPLYCISNVPVPCHHIKCRKGWPGWWSKMEIFRPDITGDVFYLDLDTIITGPFHDLLKAGELTMLSDPYRPEVVGSGLMYIPEKEKPQIWKHWSTKPFGLMQKYRRGGDQDYLKAVLGNRPKKWQEVFPNRVLSYKADKVFKYGVPKEASIVYFQGRPKPRDIDWDLSSALPGIRRKK